MVDCTLNCRRFPENLHGSTNTFKALVCLKDQKPSACQRLRCKSRRIVRPINPKPRGIESMGLNHEWILCPFYIIRRKIEAAVDLMTVGYFPFDLFHSPSAKV